MTVTILFPQLFDREVLNRGGPKSYFGHQTIYFFGRDAAILLVMDRNGLFTFFFHLK